MFGTLNLSLTGLNAAKTAVDNVSNNIANENTAGYKKRVVNLSEIDQMDDRITGRGVNASSAYRITSQYMYDKLISENTKLNYYSKLSNNTSNSDFINEITLYNKRLGMFSFMKNTNIYYTNNTKEFSNYSDRYLITLKDYLTIEKDNSDLLDVLKQNIQFKELLYTNNQIDKEFIEAVYNNIEDTEIKEIFSKVLEPNNILKTLPLLLEKEAYIYYFICLVYYFRQKDSNKKDNFKIEIKNIIPKNIAETALAILGIYFGYNILRADERIELNDEIYKQIFGNLFNMKFKLDSKFDYITVEVLYQRSFHKELGRDFEYLEYPQNIEINMNFINEEEFKHNYKYEEIETFFDKLFFKITKTDGIEND